MEGMAEILLRHVRPGQKNRVEIGKNDDETMHIREGKDGKNWQNAGVSSPDAPAAPMRTDDAPPRRRIGTLRGGAILMEKRSTPLRTLRNRDIVMKYNSYPPIIALSKEGIPSFPQTKRECLHDVARTP